METVVDQRFALPLPAVDLRGGGHGLRTKQQLCAVDESAILRTKIGAIETDIRTGGNLRGHFRDFPRSQNTLRLQIAIGVTIRGEKAKGGPEERGNLAVGVDRATRNPEEVFLRPGE